MNFSAVPWKNSSFSSSTVFFIFFNIYYFFLLDLHNFHNFHNLYFLISGFCKLLNISYTSRFPKWKHIQTNEQKEGEKKVNHKKRIFFLDNQKINKNEPRRTNTQ